MAKDDSELAGLLDLNFDHILQEEQVFLQNKHNTCSKLGEAADKPSISLAFSGGGTRAAAFQSGVLWRLAQSGLLKHVDYFVAVSGGAYIAASFASHLLAAKPPASSADNVDTWYLDIVARTICRMQRNAGGFIRDPQVSKLPGKHDGSGSLPRVLDGPLFALMVVVAIFANPLQLLIFYLVPFTEVINLFFGAGLQAAICAPPSVPRWDVLLSWSPILLVLRILELSIAASFVVWILMRRLSYNLTLRSCSKCLVRLSSCCFLLLTLLFIVPQLQIMWAGGEKVRQAVCHKYIEAARAGHRSVGCSNYYQGRPWYEDKMFIEFGEKPEDVIGNSSKVHSLHGLAPDESLIMQLEMNAERHSKSALSLFLCFFAFVLVVAALLIPYIPSLFLHVLTIAGPVFALLLVMIVVKYRIYGPLSGQPLILGRFPFVNAYWNGFACVCISASLLLVPFYNDCKRFWHYYYVRSLRQNFFDGGQDVSLQELKMHPHCPLMMFTGTANDYGGPGNKLGISEISFSPLHTGSQQTGFSRTPEYRTLSKCTALSGAGFLDALGLSMTNAYRYRIWLELLNLTWGDYILFNPERSFKLFNFGKSRRMITFANMLPSLLCFAIGEGLMVLGWFWAMQAGNRECPTAKNVATVGTAIFVFVLLLSFFAFLPRLHFLMWSPIVRQIHQITGFTYRAERPPGLLYITDGGIQDCTGIVQLVRRRCKRILLVLAASDPDDELGVLRTAMDVIASEKLASFYDLEDPQLDIRILLEEYKNDPSKMCLHFGIQYGWSSQPKSESTGQLFVVKLRLPPNLNNMQVHPLLSEEEVKSGKAQVVKVDCEAQSAPNDAELVANLGGLGCCDCCHRHGCNCGNKFPHLTGLNYLWLTPQLFSNLCRLGHMISEEAVSKLML